MGLFETNPHLSFRKDERKVSKIENKRKNESRNHTINGRSGGPRTCDSPRALRDAHDELDLDRSKRQDSNPNLHSRE